MISKYVMSTGFMFSVNKTYLYYNNQFHFQPFFNLLKMSAEVRQITGFTRNTNYTNIKHF